MDEYGGCGATVGANAAQDTVTVVAGQHMAVLTLEHVHRAGSNAFAAADACGCVEKHYFVAGYDVRTFAASRDAFYVVFNRLVIYIGQRMEFPTQSFGKQSGPEYIATVGTRLVVAVHQHPGTRAVIAPAGKLAYNDTASALDDSSEGLMVTAKVGSATGGKDEYILILEILLFGKPLQMYVMRREMDGRSETDQVVSR